MSCCSMQTLKTIAEEVARAERADLEVTAVLPGEARSSYAEVLLMRHPLDADAVQLLVGVARDLPEPMIRRTFAASLRAAL